VNGSIAIEASGVDVDLNGFALSGDNIIRAADVQEIAIHDGTLLPGVDLASQVSRSRARTTKYRTIR
jgi:hypothetical protein